MLADKIVRRRVVVTGMGVVSPLGCTVDDFWRNLTCRPGRYRTGDQVRHRHVSHEAGR